MIFFIAILILFLPVTILLPTKVICKNKFPKKHCKQGYVISSNHLSNYDVILFDVKFRRKIYYMAKIELFKNKFFGWLLTKLGAIKVDRATSDVTAYKNAIKTLKNNKPLGVFPEGTRNKGDDQSQMLEAKSGAVVFASKTGVPIIPLAIYRRPKLFRRNKILVGDPFYPQGVNPKKLTKEEVEQNVTTLTQIINGLHAQLVQTYSKAGKKALKKVAAKA